ncbi:conserved hypothetical protein [uncultured Pleomorphomonas sp.]|uniref:Uncharacterized protein n=1 Tax=uncultured Pleomorphomonas sp. TaxID=442121 RepID=A0A212LG81_9HYPH|nr:conserved hypothetical protein [uncultured Pleomorphomonas sp.]
MPIEFDPTTRATNLQKHRVDLADTE